MLFHADKPVVTAQLPDIMTAYGRVLKDDEETKQ